MCTRHLEGTRDVRDADSPHHPLPSFSVVEPPFQCQASLREDAFQSFFSELV